ncbi:hypothetical protein B0H17DRAFT_1135817 [Mycena rosella]|uniref:Uncharacterized protein n=1 Tax=Mycena rosella TaxID=1033263 RepID=A0AAD7GCN6_MYCRO|nr:hypothetical protein B0H17DRAFT_1135817 [Mycena rosella]
MSPPSSVPLLPAREGEVLRRRDATLPVDFPGSDAAFAAGAAVGPCNTPNFFSSNHHDGIESVGGTIRESHSLQGEVLHSDYSTVDLLPLYLVDRDPLAVDDSTTVQTDPSRLSYVTDRLRLGKDGIERIDSARQLDRTKPSNFQVVSDLRRLTPKNRSYSMSCDNHQSKPTFFAILEVLVMGSAVWNMKYERTTLAASEPPALAFSVCGKNFLPAPDSACSSPTHTFANKNERPFESILFGCVHLGPEWTSEGHIIRVQCPGSVSDVVQDIFNLQIAQISFAVPSEFIQDIQSNRFPNIKTPPDNPPW